MKFVMDKLPIVYKGVFAADIDKHGKVKFDDKLECSELEIRLEVFNLQKSYGFSYLGNCERLVITPLTLKA
jgi:hypothetical protein